MSGLTGGQWKRAASVWYRATDLPMIPSDAQLIALARTAREDAIELLYRAYRGKIYSLLLRLTGDADTADDLTQDTFVKAYRALDGLTAEHRLLPWLYRIANNAVIDAARRRKRVSWLSLPSLADRAEEPHSPDSHGSVAEREHIDRAFRDIPVENAMALLLHAIEGYSYREIAEIQGCSLTAVRSRIARARAAFKDAYATSSGGQASSQ